MRRKKNKEDRDKTEQKKSKEEGSSVKPAQIRKENRAKLEQNKSEEAGSSVQPAKISKEELAESERNLARTWTCPFRDWEDCGSPFNFPDFVEHYRARHRPAGETMRNSLVCEHCGFQSDRKKRLLQHLNFSSCVMQPSKDALLQCQECPVDYVGLRNLITHVHLRHAHIMGPHKRGFSFAWSSFTCEVCLTVFDTADSLKEHQICDHMISARNFITDYLDHDIPHASWVTSISSSI